MTDNPFKNNIDSETRLDHEIQSPVEPKSCVSSDDKLPSLKPHANPVDKQEILDQIVDDFLDQYRQGKKPTVKDYQAQYPDWQTEIGEILGSVAMIEELKLQSDSAGREKRKFESIQFDQIGDYRIERELGRGGMGIVFEAIHESLGRRVAIKILPTKVFENDDVLMRFRREAKAAARLHHSNIVNVFGVGEHEGFHYYVMELVEGETLSDWIRKARASLSIDDSATDKSGRTDRYYWSAKQISSVADALDYAHQNGILHRDIKPSNILVDQDEQFWVTDFGLVKELTNQTITTSGDVFGTPKYMAPESLEGLYDQRSEVYCLGITLYELLALRPAFSDSSPSQLFHRISTQTPTSLKQVQPRVPRDLETIVHKAIDRDPARRYQSAGELRDELQRFFRDLPIKARRTTPPERLARWSRRNPVLASLGMLSALLLILISVISCYAYVTTKDSLEKLSAQHRELQQTQQSLKNAKKLAEENELRTRREYERAESNVNLSMEAFDRLFVRIMTKGVGRNLRTNIELETFSELSTLESSVTREDAKILQGAIEFYEQFTEKNEGNQKLQLEIAKAYRRIANTYHFLGSFNLAQSNYRKAIESYTTLVSANPDDPDRLVTLAETHNELGLAYRKQGKLASGMRQHELARQILQAAKTSDSQNVKYELGNTLIQLCSFSQGMQGIRARTWRQPRALDNGRQRRQSLAEYLKLVPKRTALLRSAESISNDLLRQQPHNPDFRLQRARLYQAKAQIFGVDGDTNVEVVQLRQAISELEKLVKDYPDDPNFLFALAHIHTVRMRNISTKEQIAMYEKAAEYCRELVIKYPSVIEYLDLHASVTLRMGNWLGNNDRLSDGIKSTSRAKDSFKKLIEKTPYVLAYPLKYVAASNQLAQLRLQEKDLRGARSEWQELIRYVQNSPSLNRNRAWKQEILESTWKNLRAIRPNKKP